MPERQDALDKVRLGNVGILIIAPERLRGTLWRECGLWAIDEAHRLQHRSRFQTGLQLSLTGPPGKPVPQGQACDKSRDLGAAHLHAGLGARTTSGMRTSRDRGKTTCRRQGAPEATGKTPTACCCSRGTMWSAGSGCPPDPALPTTRSSNPKRSG